jgi:hypothetical protein
VRKTFVLIIAMLSSSFAHGQEIRDGQELLRAMHDRYKNSWYQTVTFKQKSTTYKADGSSSAETWYEAASIPGRLRIDIGSPTAGNGYVFFNGDLSVIKDNKVTDTRHSVNMLLVLGFDVYRQDPDITAKIVKEEGYDLSKIHEDTWDGKPAYVVGAAKGDLRSKQFWVEKDTLLFLRDIEPAGRMRRRLKTFDSSTTSRSRAPGSRPASRSIQKEEKLSPRITPRFSPM